MKIYPDLSKTLKFGKKLLHKSPPIDEIDPLGCGCTAHQLAEMKDAESRAVVPALIMVICMVLALGLMVMCCNRAHAYSEEDAIKVIVGESADQGFKGMVAVGEVIRNKHSLRGFCGFHAKHSASEPQWIWKQARKAWLASKTSHLTKGANHFENVNAFGSPYWVKNSVETFRYRDHIFYLEIV